MLLRRTLFVAALLGALVVLDHAAFADATAEARKSVQALYAKGDAALKKGDLKAIFNFVTPDYVTTLPDGQKITLAQMKAMYQMQAAQFQMIKAKMQAASTIQTFRLNGKEATAKVKSHFEANGVNPQDKKPLKIVIDGMSEDVWVKGAKGWLMKRTHVLSQKQTLNGQEITPPPMTQGK